MKQKSVGVNAVLNTIRTICQVVFPLITFPYVSRVLHVENIGIYNFCQSIISYFTLVAGLGINTYAIREGARHRDNKEEMSRFASEIFSINIISTIISYLVLLLCILYIPRLHTDVIILLILGTNIIFTTFGCEWVFQIYEEYGYITLRSVIFQITSLALLFAFVKDSNDLIPYTIISMVSTSGANIINAFARRKYCHIKFILSKNVLKHLTPILLLFANSVATTIYTSSDTTMLGIISGNRATGLYSVSTKIYSIVKQLLAAIIIVSVPRLSSYLGNNNRERFNNLSNQIYNALIVIVVPSMIGIFSLSKDIILVISGQEYIGATLSLQILAVALLFSIFSWFYTSCILIPNREENKVLGATIIAAGVNIGLNFILIPIIQQNGAAITTVLAEFISMVICYYYGKNYFRATIIPKDIISVMLGCIGIIVMCFLAEKYIAKRAVSF